MCEIIKICGNRTLPVFSGGTCWLYKNSVEFLKRTVVNMNQDELPTMYKWMYTTASVQVCLVLFVIYVVLKVFRHGWNIRKIRNFLAFLLCDVVTPMSHLQTVKVVVLSFFIGLSLHFLHFIYFFTETVFCQEYEWKMWEKCVENWRLALKCSKFYF